MVTKADLITDVGILTNKPHLVVEIELAVRRAIVKLHRQNNFFPDFVETTLVVPSGHSHDILLATIEAAGGNRKIRGISYVNSFSNPIPQGFSLIPPEYAISRNYQINANSWYLSGASIHILSRNPETEFIFGYYVHPVTTDPGIVADWLVQEYPELVVTQAAVELFTMVKDFQSIKARNDDLILLNRALVGDKLDEIQS